MVFVQRFMAKTVYQHKLSLERNNKQKEAIHYPEPVYAHQFLAK